MSSNAVSRVAIHPLWVGNDIRRSHGDGKYCVYEKQKWVLDQKGTIKLTIGKKCFAYVQLTGPPKRISGKKMRKLTYKYKWCAPKSKEGDTNWYVYFEYDTL